MTHSWIKEAGGATARARWPWRRRRVSFRLRWGRVETLDNLTCLKKTPLHSGKSETVGTEITSVFSKAGGR